MGLQAVYKASNIQEALELMELYKDRSKIIAGGTDLIIKLREKRINPEVLVDISSLKEMIGISLQKGDIEIGAATNFGTISRNHKLQNNTFGLVEAARSIGAPQIRNSATIGGNICNASPAADIIPPLLALDSMVTIRNKAAERKVLLEEFLLDKGKVSLNPNELLYSVGFKQLTTNQSMGFAKLGLRKALAISRISVAIFIELQDGVFKSVRIATGACGKLPNREGKIEDFLKDKPLDHSVINGAGELFKRVIEERLNGRNAVDYKKEAIKGVFKEALFKALSYQNQ